MTRIMPAALDVNWGAIKILAQTIGVREAARQVGINENAVIQRSAREGWLRDMPRSQPLPPSVRKAVTNVISAPEASVNYLKGLLLQTRTNHAKVALVASKEMVSIAEATPQVLRDQETAQTLLTHAKHAALAGGWQDQAAAPKVNLSVTGINARTIEAEVIQDTDLSTETPASTDLADY